VSGHSPGLRAGPLLAGLRQYRMIAAVAGLELALIDAILTFR
jgi:hypothetical protein